MTAKDTARGRTWTWLLIVGVVVVGIVLGVIGYNHPRTVDTPRSHRITAAASPSQAAPAAVPPRAG